jgi:competence protein ComEA
MCFKENVMRNICLLLAVVLSFVTGMAAFPVESSADTTKATTEASVPLSGKVNINTADEAILTTLPGIGPKTAVAILDFRKENGDFKAVEDLQLVKGIGSKKFEKILPYLETI